MFCGHGSACEDVVVVEALAVEALDREGRRVTRVRCSGMGAREAVGGSGDTIVLADRDAPVAPYGVRKIERLRVGLRVRGQRVQVTDLARDVVAILIIIDAVQLPFVAATLVLAVGRVCARGAAVADLDAAGAERAVCAELGGE